MTTSRRPKTALVHSGRPSTGPVRPVNPPVMRASTLLYEDIGTRDRIWSARSRGERLLSYGRRGTTTSHALEDALTELEGAYRTRLFPSGLAAISAVFLAFLRPGDHVAISDSVYGPVKKLVCREILDPFGIEHDFFRADGSDLEQRLRSATRLVYAECPGSLVYEMLDLRELAATARRHGIPVAVDNTWASGLLLRPLELGIDISIMAATKYIVGHSDVMLGSVATTEKAWDPLSRISDALGQVVSPDDAYLALRGLRTLAPRMQMHEAHARQVIAWLAPRREVRRIFYPGLADHPGHELWLRDFRGACGLFSVEFDPTEIGDINRFIDSLELFGIGSSWGGFESLVMPVDVQATRSLSDWSRSGPILRFHIGLEDPADLIADLAAAFGSDPNSR